MDAKLEKMRRLGADIRIQTVLSLGAVGFGHIGGAASIADVLGVLYGGAMRVDPKKPDWEDRDWFVLSKGHAGPALYAALALSGYFPVEWLKTVNKPGTNLPSHCDRLKTPGIDMTTGSLGQGISAAVGIALANRMKGKASFTYCIIGDGEAQEGQVWEAAQTAAHHKLDHLIVFVDNNKKQIDGLLSDVCAQFDIEEKFRAFGWSAAAVNGHDTAAVYGAVRKAAASTGKPSVIILDTVKGLGINFAEKEASNHHMVIDEAMAKSAAEEVERRYSEGCYPGGDLR